MMKYCLLFFCLCVSQFLLAEPVDDFGDGFEETQDDFTAASGNAAAETTNTVQDAPVEESLLQDDGFGDDATVEIAFDDKPSAAEPDDRFENYNRKMSKFNDTVDHYFLKPVAKGYFYITPSVVSTGVSNFFSNIGDLPTSMNALLQGKPANSGKSVARFLVNTTIGVFGFFDVATPLGITEQKEDFGQTLATWGVPSGPYVVLPFFGPSTMRDAPALAVDMVTSPLNRVEDTETHWGLWGLKLVDKRADLLKAEEMIQGDRYLFMKNAYLQNRHYLENDGNVEDNFDNGQFEDDDGWLEEE